MNTYQFFIEYVDSAGKSYQRFISCDTNKPTREEIYKKLGYDRKLNGEIFFKSIQAEVKAPSEWPENNAENNVSSHPVIRWVGSNANSAVRPEAQSALKAYITKKCDERLAAYKASKADRTAFGHQVVKAERMDAVGEVDSLPQGDSGTTGAARGEFRQEFQQPTRIAPKHLQDVYDLVDSPSNIWPADNKVCEVLDRWFEPGLTTGPSIYNLRQAACQLLHFLESTAKPTRYRFDLEEEWNEFGGFICGRPHTGADPCALPGGETYDGLCQSWKACKSLSYGLLARVCRLLGRLSTQKELTRHETWLMLRKISDANETRKTPMDDTNISTLVNDLASALGSDYQTPDLYAAERVRHALEAK